MLNEFDYPELNFELPDELIAKFPLPERESSRLMLVDRKKSVIEIYSSFREIKEILNKNDVLVFNSTKVSKRRVFLKNENGKEFEVLFLEKKEISWLCLIKNQSKLKEKEKIYTYDSKIILSITFSENQAFLSSSIEIDESFFETYGSIPIPPYLKRKAEKTDEERYQTIFAENSGSVAAPTAGLHFTNQLKVDLIKKGIQFFDVELRIGYGTFGKLTEKNFIEKKLHSEYYYIKKDVSEKLNVVGEGRVIAIGTTSLRALESSYDKKNSLYKPYQGNTELFLTPEDKIHSIQGLITNFHLPGSSLILLVSAFAGIKLISEAYKLAIKEKFRFYSYGDAMLIL